MRSLQDAEPAVFWWDDDAAPEPLPCLTGDADAELVIIGGGFAGLWTAVRARERGVDGPIVLLEADRCGSRASGQNGGFCAASLTHGAPNGWARWPTEMPVLERLGEDNLDGIETTVDRYGIDCDFHRPGALDVATEPWQVAELAERSEMPSPTGATSVLLDTEQVQAALASPTYLAGLWEQRTTALVEPARLAWGLRAAALSLGVDVHEGTRALGVGDENGRVTVRTEHGTVRARQAVLATGTAPPLLRRLSLMTVPVWDYVLMTEPLNPAQMASIGWADRQGVGDSANLFHYSRLTRDNRVLWGGYDAVYHYASGRDERFGQRPETFTLLARQFAEAYPQLADVVFTHRWGGAIDTCTRFAAFYGLALSGRLTYAGGFTGLGVGTTRFAADVMLDLLGGVTTERTSLSMVRRRPTPFPPEPARSLGIALTKRSLAKADATGGRRDLWLRTLDRAGLGFDS